MPCGHWRLLFLAALSSCGGDSGTQPRTVTQVVITGPGSAPTLRTLQRTLAFSAQARAADGTPVGGQTITWTSDDNAVGSITAAGVLTAVSNGTAHVVAHANSVASTPVTVVVSQLAVSVQVTAPPGDSVLRTTGRTRQFSAAAADSNGFPVTNALFTWSSPTSTAIATVGASTGLVAAGAADGTASIVATATGSAASGARAQVVVHYAATAVMSPAWASILTSGGTQDFFALVQDSAGTDLPVNWTSRNAAVVTTAPIGVSSARATAKGNGTTYVVMSGGTRSDSGHVAVSGQASGGRTVTVGNNFFKSDRNLSQNPAVDTITAGGTVTWIWNGTALISHSVQSTSTYGFTFTSSPVITGDGQGYSVTFASPGLYAYNCGVHGANMSGRVLVQ